jgi:hypothetical protein
LPNNSIDCDGNESWENEAIYKVIKNFLAHNILSVFSSKIENMIQHYQSITFNEEDLYGFLAN